MSKEWNWEKNKNDLWLKPSIESYYYIEEWKNKNFKKILDLGCGLGRHAIEFAKNGFDVTACDLSNYAINNVICWGKKENLIIETKVCDMLKLPFTENSFDAIFSYHAISHTDTLGMKKVIYELKRVLKENGEIFLTLCSKETWSFTDAGYPKIDENSVIKVEDGPENGIPHFYVNLEDIYRLFNDFEIISIRHIDDIYYTDKVNHSKHYFLHLKLSRKE